MEIALVGLALLAAVVAFVIRRVWAEGRAVVLDGFAATWPGVSQASDAGELREHLDRIRMRAAAMALLDLRELSLKTEGRAVAVVVRLLQLSGEFPFSPTQAQVLRIHREIGPSIRTAERSIRAALDAVEAALPGIAGPDDRRNMLAEIAKTGRVEPVSGADALAGDTTALPQ